MPSRIVHRCPVPNSTSALLPLGRSPSLDEDHELVAAFEELHWLRGHRLIWSKEVLPVRLTFLTPPERSRRRVPLQGVVISTSGCEVAIHRIPVAAIERLVDLTHDLHVLLRHRLLRQPGGFEGLDPGRETTQPNDLPVREP